VAAIALALGASLTWGLADFYGPLKGRTLGALRVLFYVQLSGLVAIAIVVAIRGAGPAGLAVLLAIPAAISGTFGLYAYYRRVAVGTISIVAPIAGLAAVIPVAVGIASGDRPSSWQVAGMVCALGGVFLASREPAAERPVRVSGPVEGAWGRREAPVREADRGKGSGETGRFPQRASASPLASVLPCSQRLASAATSRRCMWRATRTSGGPQSFFGRRRPW
jgi:uncharacterized membrane protein